jgi:hypothetical protein
MLIKILKEKHPSQEGSPSVLEELLVVEAPKKTLMPVLTLVMN